MIEEDEIRAVIKRGDAGEMAEVLSELESSGSEDVLLFVLWGVLGMIARWCRSAVRFYPVAIRAPGPPPLTLSVGSAIPLRSRF